MEVTPRFVEDHVEMQARLLATLPLHQERLVLFGREVRTPRLTSLHGDPGCEYAYSGRRFAPQPWTPELSALRDRVSRVAGVAFNTVLGNLYRSGEDSMGRHADDEPELGPSQDDIRIASVSLGARRRFIMRHRATGKRWVLELGEGDLLVMGGTTQQHYQHEVPKTRKHVGPRLNLTFRVVVEA